MFDRLAILATLAITGCASSITLAEDTAQGQEAFLDACEDWDEWEKSAPPFRIYGNSYYVGSCGIAVILITGEDGHVLIDGGSRGGGPLVEQSIEQLGFKLEDVKLLLHSHEHYDHVGGLSYLQKKTGAEVIASKGSAEALTTGETQPDDPQFGMHEPFEPVAVARIVSSYEPVALGKITLMPLETPGHTSGALTWSWWSCEKTDCRMLVYADSLSPVSSDSYRFSDHPDYLAKYRAGLDTLAETPCDILLTPHPSASRMLERMASEQGLTGEGECRKYAEAVGQRLDKRLSKEAGGD